MSRNHGVLRLLLDEAAQLTGLTRGRLYLQDRTGEALRLRATVGCATSIARWPEFIGNDADLADAVSGKAVVHLSAGDMLFSTLQPHGRTGILLIGLIAADGAIAGVIVLDDELGVEIDHASLAFAAAAGAAAGAALDHEDLSRQLDESSRRSRSLQAGISIERTLGRLVGGPRGVAAMVEACAELTGKAVAVYGQDHRVIAQAGLPGRTKASLPALAALLSAVGDRTSAEPIEVASRPLAGLTRRHLITPVTVDEESYGWLVLLEHPSGLRPFDALVVRLAARYVGRELGVQRRVADVAWNARSSLARQLVNGSNDLDDLRTSGEYLGVKTDARRVLVYVIGAMVHEATSAELQRLAENLQHQLNLEVLITRGSEGVMLLVEAPATGASAEFVARVKQALKGLRSRGPGAPLTAAGVSSVCDPRGLARAYREAREVARCIDRFASAGATRILAVDDLGPARLFVANSAIAAVRAYVDDVLGALLTGESGMTDLIATLGCYFDSGRSVRLSAARLGVHENTVRLRLARISAATGLDVAADANNQLSAQTALLVLRLQGHPALPSFEDTAADVSRTA